MEKLKYGPIAATLAKQQLDYLIANSRLQHTDDDGAFSVRAAAAGLHMAGEVLAGVWTTGNYKSDVDIAYQVWTASPGHYAQIINPIYNCIGWADGFYPDTVTSIITGAGQYDPTSGTYTTGEAVLEISEEYRGKLRVFIAVLSNEN